MFKKALSILLSVMLVVTSLSVAAVSVAAVDDGTKFIVAGSSLDIFGMTWNDSNEDNLMEAKEDGSYEIVYYDVAPEDNVQLKVVEKPADGSPAVWHGDKTGNNVTFNITADCDVTVNYNPATEEISVAGEYVEYVTGLEIERMVAAGNGDPNSDPNYLHGIGWDPGSAQNEMIEVEEGVYEITFENVSENMGYEIKFAAGSWVNNWGGTFVGSGIETPADYNGGNIAFDVEDDDSTIVARIDLREFDFASKKGAKFTITINDVIEEPPTEPEPETTVLPDETEVPVTDAVTTVAEEETTVKADEPSDNETFSVKGTSNFFPEYTQVFDKDTDTVTVTYKLTSSKNLVNFEWYLSYDPEALRFDPALNMNEDYEWMIVPAAKSSVINADNPSGPGTINGNAASVSSLYKIASNDGKPVTLFTITFKVIDPKDSTVNLDVRNLTLGLRNPETMLLDPESEESVVKSYQKNPESTAVSEVATQVYEGEYDPDYTPATTPAVEETTVAEETTQKAEETTKPAEVETTKAAQPSEGSLKVTGTSNYFPKTVQSFTQEELAAKDNLVTVTYKINSPKNLLNTDWELNWDPTVLKYVEDYNVNADWEQQVMPQVPDLILNANADKVENGRMLGNYSSASANHALTNNGEEVTFVTVTFEVIGEGDTTVDLNVKELTIVQRIKGKADPTTSERVVTHNQPQDIETAVTNNTYVYAGPYDPDYVPSDEPTTVAEETTEPVEETTTAPVVEETTTAPVVEETTTAPVEPTTEPTTVPVEDVVYVVAGTPNITGYNWNGSPDTGLILEPDGDGYSYTFENVDTVGDEMQVKVVGNAADGKQTWYGDEKGQNVTFKVTKPTDVKVYFDPATGIVSVSGDGVELITDLEITNGIRIVGAADSGKGNWLNGISWNEKADENLMTEITDKVYSITFNDLPEEMGYEFKIAANGSWNANWGIDAEKTEVVFNTPFDAAFNGNNITFDLDEDSDVTVVLDLTNFDYPTKEGAKITIKVTPSAEEETSEPVVEETTTEPAVEETTTAPVAEDTTVAPTPGSFLTVTGTSNYFPKTVQSFTQEELNAKDNLVTVTYKINSPKNLLNTDWELNWDPTVLKYVEDYNVNADWEQQVMPQVPDLILNANADKVENGRMLGNYSSASANHALTNNGEEVTFVTVTFEVIGEGDTTVDLNVKELTIVQRIKGKADPTTSERVVTHNQPQDIETAVTNNTYVYAGPYDPDYVPSDEPTTVAEETTEPVEETTTAPVVEETTTAPVVEETTTAPVEPTTEPTTAPVEDVVYVVAGTPNITGYNWNGSPDTGLILEPDGDGYSYTFENVDIVGDEIQVKVVGNAADGKQTWYGDEKGQNVTFKVTKPTDVKVYFDPATGIVSVSGDGVELITELDITNGIRIVGAADSGKGNWLNGISWNEKADENLMTEITDKVYSITFNDLPEEMGYEFKIAANGSWNANWGIDAEKTEVVFNTPFDAAFNGNNITFDLDEESDVTVVLDLTNFDYPTKEGAKITIKVTPSEEEVTTAPVVEETTTEPAVEETTTEPVAEETTTAPVAEETTIAPTPGSFLTVTGTSNYFPKTVQSFTKEELAAKDNLVTVTYKINSPKNLLNTDWELNWDPNVLQYVEDYNVNADWEQQVMPQVPDLILNANPDKVENGRMLGNYSSASANHALTNNGEEVTFVTVTFRAIGEGDTTVDLNVKELTIVERIKGKADPTTSERVVTRNQPQDIETVVNNNTYVYAGPYDPDYVPSDEPTTVAEETTVPVVETTTEPVEETTTAPVVEETTTAPVVEETTTAPVAEETTTAPVVEETTTAPVVEETTTAPVVEETTTAPVVEETTTAPVVEETTTAPVVEETTTAPVVEETTTAPVVEETTTAPVAEETTTAPVADETTIPVVSNTLTVNATSNLCSSSQYIVNLDEADPQTITVLYYLAADKKISNTAWKLNYDAEHLTLQSLTMPKASDAVINSGKNPAIGWAASITNPYDFTTKGVFVQATFSATGAGVADVDLFVEDLTLVEFNGDGEPVDTTVIRDGVVQTLDDITDNESEIIKGVPSDEPTAPVADETTAPVAEDTTAPVADETTAPVAEETTAPVAEETTAPVAEETTAPVAEETTAPVAEETTAPVAEETTAPVAEETTAPVAEETTAPVAEETTAPVAEETTAPVAEETTAPVAEETTAPVAEETTAPVAEETTAPVAEETTAPVAEETTAPVAEDTTAPVEPTSAPSADETTTPASVEPTTDAGSKIEPVPTTISVDGKSTADQASSDQINKGGTSTTSSNAVQTGNASMAVIILLVLISATAAIYFARKRERK